MVHPYVRSHDDLLCLAAQPQEHGGGARRTVTTLGQLDGAIEGQQPNTRPVSALFYKEEQEKQ